LTAAITVDHHGSRALDGRGDLAKGKAMKAGSWIIGAATAVLITGCATSLDIVPSGNLPGGAYVTAALVQSESTNDEMDGYIRDALVLQGVQVGPSKPAGTKKADGVDLLVSYFNEWRWDLKTYLLTLRIDLFDGPTGALLATGTWKNSGFHGFQRGEEETKALLGSMIPTIRAGTK
jgi:hypothetical protein